MNQESNPKPTPQLATRLRIYIGEADHHGGQPLYAAIVQLARKRGIAGATVLRGIQGYGARSIVHAASIVDMSADLPLLVELVDESSRIADFITAVSEMVDDGMMTTENVSIVYQSHGKKH